jgi:integrase
VAVSLIPSRQTRGARRTATFNGKFNKKLNRHVGLLRGVCRITDRDLTLHSTRHSFIDAMRRAKIGEGMECRARKGNSSQVRCGRGLGGDG